MALPIETLVAGLKQSNDTLVAQAPVAAPQSQPTAAEPAPAGYAAGEFAKAVLGRQLQNVQPQTPVQQAAPVEQPINFEGLRPPEAAQAPVEGVVLQLLARILGL